MEVLSVLLPTRYSGAEVKFADAFLYCSVLARAYVFFACGYSTFRTL